MNTRRFLLSAVLLFAVSFAFAESPRPYLGGGFSFTIISEDTHHPYHSSGGWCGTPYIGDDYQGPGLLLEGGWMGSFHDLHGEASGASGYFYSTKWQSLRLGIGGRLRVPDNVKNPLKPFIGGGLQAGWARYSGSHKSAMSSKLSGGFFAELGVMINARSPLRPAIMIRYDRLNSRIDLPWEWIPGADYISLTFALFGLL